MRNGLVVAALTLAIAAPLSAQSPGRSGDHGRHRGRQARPAAPARHHLDRRDRARRGRRDHDRDHARDRYRTRGHDRYGRRGPVRYRDRDRRRVGRRYRDRDDHRSRFGARIIFRYLGHDRDDWYRLDRPYRHGRFRYLGRRYRHPLLRIDVGARRLRLGSGFLFEIAAWDWPYTRRWCWECDEFAVYRDSGHPGWYRLYDVRLGEYVHVRYLGG